MTNERTWPEPPAERQARKQKMIQKRGTRRDLPDVDTRTPSGRHLPY
jgi:hypothetical protein